MLVQEDAIVATQSEIEELQKGVAEPGRPKGLDNSETLAPKLGVFNGEVFCCKLMVVRLRFLVVQPSVMGCRML